MWGIGDLWRTLAFALAILGAQTGAAAAGPGDRVALVIGNSAYPSGVLPNPASDAALIGTALAARGFSLHTLTDATTSELETFLSSVAAEVTNAEIVFLYFAGHGFQYRGDNRLLMVNDVQLGLDGAIAASVSISDIIQRLTALNPGLVVLSLDACRDNPFADTATGIEEGLGFVEAGIGQVMIGYATGAGQISRDGLVGNSPYAIALANALQFTSSGSLMEVFRVVRRQVREATFNLQVPWVTSSIERDFFLGTTPQAETAAVPGLPTDLLPLDEVFWYFVNPTDPADLQAYVETFPAGTHRAEAEMSLGRGLLGPGGAVRQPAEGVGPVLFDGMRYGTTVDRQPAAPLTTWPTQLPPNVSGLAGIVTNCDALAADPSDPARVSPGVQNTLITVRLAARACLAAVKQEPQQPRLLFQLGRALIAAQLYPWGLSFLQAAIDLGYGAAMVQMATLYQRGLGVTRNYDIMFELNMRAALLGNPSGRVGVAAAFRDGLGVERSYEEAILWLRLAGSMGWPNAIDALANMYRRGLGTPASPEAAFQLYQIAASAGNTNALTNIGLSYLNGWGVPVDDVEAGRWLEASAATGNRFATRALGNYLLAKGDSVRAEQMLRTSIEQDNQDARLDLAAFYRSRGGPGDAEEAYFQMLMAEARGVAVARERMPPYTEALAAYDRSLVEARVAEWLRVNGD